MIHKKSVKITAEAYDTHFPITLPDHLETSGLTGSYRGKVFEMPYSIRPL